MLRRRIAAVLGSVLLLAPHVRPACAGDFDTGRAANDFTALLPFVAAGSLTPADRERVAAETRKQYAANAQLVRSEDAKVRQLLTGIGKAPA